MKNKSVIVALATLAVSFTACKKELKTDQSFVEKQTVATVDASKFDDVRMCTELYPEGVTPRGATIKAKQWPNGSVIKVSLNGGNSYLRNKVIQYASLWEQYANIDFRFVTNDNTAPIRVTFKSGGSYSYLGTDARYISRNRETMNFGWFNNYTSDAEFRRTTVHEFGHALGMIHEHQHPLADIPWDKPRVYEYYAATQGWSKAQVDNNLFATYTTSQTNFSGYDRASIMHYAVEEGLTVGNFSVGWNTDLSSTDKAFIAAVYPK